MDCTIYVAKTKALISFAVASLFSHMQKSGFLMTRLILLHVKTDNTAGASCSQHC